jgi:hypothetical protein
MPILAASFAAAFAVSLVSAEAAPRSSSGPWTKRYGAAVAPVDSLGPTLAPDNLMTGDSGWNSSGTSGIAGPSFTTRTPLFGPPLVAPRRKKPYIILNGQ